MMKTDLNDLYKIYEANINVDKNPHSTKDASIKVGDLVVAIYNGKEIRGEVSAVYESYYHLKGKSGGSLKVTMDDITEHYPKNRTFENKSVKKFSDVEQPKVNENVPPPLTKDEQKEEQKPLLKKKKMIKEVEEEEMKNNPDDQVDLTVEHKNSDIKSIGKVVYYKDVKFSEINDMFEKKLLSKEIIWYLLTEKQNEIHVVRNNDKGFQIQPFVSALVGHFLKKDGKLNESFNQIKIKGNDNFSVISNIPTNVHHQLLNTLIGVLSEIKK